MSLLDKIGTPPPVPGTHCGVKRAAMLLNNSDQEDLYQLVDDPRWPYVTLARKLREANVQVSEKAIRKHRLGHCSCHVDGGSS